MTAQSGQYDSPLSLAEFQTVGDYTDNNNPSLVKWQNQTDDKSARFLAKLDRETDLDAAQFDTGDPWQFYDNPMQKMVVNMGLNNGTTGQRYFQRQTSIGM